MAFEEFQNLWPTCWKEAEQLLHRVGYIDAKKYFICFDESHRCHYGIMSSENEMCHHCHQKGSITFYYLGLGPKINLWTSDPEMCKKMLSHWQEKEHWLEQENSEGWGFQCKKEIWDGKRFAELQWFWNPEKEWELPTKCVNCATVISAKDIETSPDICDSEERKLITCKSCHQTFQHIVQKTYGDPRNLAYIAHWDGFQPFDGKYNHGSGAIEVQIANMCKKDRQQNSEIYVVGFVPVYLLPDKRPVSLDPFLYPLISEIEDGFIDGITVNYAYSLPQLPAGIIKLRHILLCFTGDHPAICEVCKAIFCGKNPCRRCKCGSTLIPLTNHYYYGDYRKSARYPWPKRNLEDEIGTVKTIEEEERKTVAETMAKEAGFTGLSVLHRLHALYGFDYRKDCVFDNMHMVALGVIKNHFSFLLDNGIVDKKQIQERPNVTPWTAEFMSLRYPTQLSRIGFWKAEEFQKFAFPISEYVLGGLLPNNHFEAWECLVRIVEYMYCQGRSGWTVDSAAIFQEMVLRYNVLVEETQGLRSCHAVNHNLTHVHEDVLNFGAPDNYWCYNFERAVGRYVLISTNHKNIEITFARAELRREVLKVRNSIKAQGHSSNQVLEYEGHYKSISALKESLSHFSEEALDIAENQGILVGALKGVHLSDQMRRNSVLEHFSDRPEITNDCLSDVAEECRSIYFVDNEKHDGLLYRIGEKVIYKLPHTSEERVMSITQCLQVKVDSLFYLLVAGEAFQYVLSGSEKAVHQWSKGLIVQQTGIEVIVPSVSIQRKIMLFPQPDSLNDPQSFIICDFQRPQFPVTSVVVPCYPEVGDMVLIKGDDPEPWRGLVTAVQHRNLSVQVQFYVPHGRWGRSSGLWVREGTRTQAVLFKSIVGRSTGTWRGTGNALYKEY